MNRASLLLHTFDSSGFGLEIGPSFNPLLPKSAGFRVEILDNMSAEELRQKYADNPSVDTSKIEEVDYVSNGGSIHALIGKIACYDFIVASHVVEHTTDMLGFLLDCEKLLNDKGVLVLVVPDKRYCFDVIRPLSTTGAILQAHIEQRKRHSAGTVFDEVAYSALRDGKSGWNEHNAGKLTFVHALDKAKTIFENVRDTGAYMDVHAWQFTPSSFRLIISDLNDIGYLGLRENYFHPTIDFEFYVTLSKASKGCAVTRDSLVKALLQESRNIQS